MFQLQDQVKTFQVPQNQQEQDRQTQVRGQLAAQKRTVSGLLSALKENGRDTDYKQLRRKQGPFDTVGTNVPLGHSARSQNRSQNAAGPSTAPAQLGNQTAPVNGFRRIAPANTAPSTSSGPANIALNDTAPHLVAPAMTGPTDTAPNNVATMNSNIAPTNNLPTSSAFTSLPVPNAASSANSSRPVDSFANSPIGNSPIGNSPIGNSHIGNMSGNSNQDLSRPRVAMAPIPGNAGGSRATGSIFGGDQQRLGQSPTAQRPTVTGTNGLLRGTVPSFDNRLAYGSPNNNSAFNYGSVNDPTSDSHLINILSQELSTSPARSQAGAAPVPRNIGTSPSTGSIFGGRQQQPGQSFTARQSPVPGQQAVHSGFTNPRPLAPGPVAGVHSGGAPVIIGNLNTTNINNTAPYTTSSFVPDLRLRDQTPGLLGNHSTVAPQQTIPAPLAPVNPMRHLNAGQQYPVIEPRVGSQEHPLTDADRGWNSLLYGNPHYSPYQYSDEVKSTMRRVPYGEGLGQAPLGRYQELSCQPQPTLEQDGFEISRAGPSSAPQINNGLGGQATVGGNWFQEASARMDQMKAEGNRDVAPSLCPSPKLIDSNYPEFHKALYGHYPQEGATKESFCEFCGY